MGIWDTLFLSIPALIGAGGTLYITKYFEDKKEKRQLEQLKLQIITENRKASCIKVNEEINRALKTIRLNKPYDDAWDPTEPRLFESTREALTKEFLFVEKSVAQALNLFLTIMSETVLWDYERDMGMSLVDKDRIIKRAYEELEYISEHITDFLRAQINLVNEEPSIMMKVALLKLCRIISKSEFDGLRFPNQDIIKLDRAQSPIDIVRDAENNLVLFKSELVNFLTFLKTNPLNYRDTQYLYFISEIDEAEKLLRDL
jgi:hypothetical protein